MTDYPNMDFPEEPFVVYELLTPERVYRLRKGVIERNLFRGKIRIDDDKWQDVWINMSHVVSITKRKQP